MELDDYRQLWQEQTDSLSALRVLGVQTARSAAARTAGTALDRLAQSLVREAALWAITIVLLGGYVADRFAHTGAAVSGALLDIYAGVLLAAVIRQLVLVRAIDPSEPVVRMQTRLANVRALRARTTIAALALGPLMWAPLAVVGADIVTGSGAAWLSTPYLVANVAFGVAVLVGAIVGSRRFGSRLEESSGLRAVADALNGTAMRRASASLASVREFAEGAR